MPTLTSEEVFETAVATLNAAEYCFFITISSSGQPHSRLVHPFKPEPDMSIWIGTSPETRKIREITNDNRATLAYQHPSEEGYTVLLGTTEIITDEGLKKKYWLERWREFYPTGPQGQDYVVVKFTPERMEVINFDRNVVPEPYGMHPASLIRTAGTWELD